MSDETYIRTVRFYTPELSAKKAAALNRAMKDYRRARSFACDYFAEQGTSGFGYSEENDLYKEIHGRSDINLGARTIQIAIRVVEQNYSEYEADRSASPPKANNADTYGLDTGFTRIFCEGGRYYLNVHLGPKRVNIPLRVTDGEYHQNILPAPDRIPARDSNHQRTPGTPFKELDAEAYPPSVVKVGGSTLTKVAPRVFCVDLAVHRKKPVRRNGSVDDRRYIVGVDRGRNQLAYAALYDRQEDHVIDWWNRGGDGVEHYLDEFSKRISEFQSAQVWDEMEDARARRFRYKDQIDYEIANGVVDLARGRFGVGIVLEDLSSMSRLGSYSVENRRFSEWSYYRLEQYIRDKAEQDDIPVGVVNPSYTSSECSRCGVREETTRDSIHFRCSKCGYEQHSDANAAVNIAKKVV